jgi:hypothetical protein
MSRLDSSCADASAKQSHQSVGHVEQTPGIIKVVKNNDETPNIYVKLASKEVKAKIKMTYPLLLTFQRIKRASRVADYGHRIRPVYGRIRVVYMPYFAVIQVNVLRPYLCRIIYGVFMAKVR